MNPYRSTRVVTEPGPRWWRAVPPLFWAYPANVAFSLAGIAYHAATFGPRPLFHLAFLTIHASIVVANAWFGRRYWRRHVAPRLTSRARILPAGGEP